MTIFNGLLEAKKGALKNGAIPALAIAIAAPNKKVAENIIIGKLWKPTLTTATTISNLKSGKMPGPTAPRRR